MLNDEAAIQEWAEFMTTYPGSSPKAGVTLLERPEFLALTFAEVAQQSGGLKELDRFGMGVDAVGEEDGVGLLAAVDCDEELGVTGRE